MKRNIFHISLSRFWASAFAVLALVTLSGCFEEPNEMAILDDDDVVIPLITERLDARSDLSYFAAVLKAASFDAEIVDEKTDIATPVTVNFWNTFSGYGTYTLFAPNNDAVKAWLTEYFPAIDQSSPATVQEGISKLDDESMLFVANTIQYHICNDSIPTTQFVMGKFPYPTLLESFLLLSKEQGTYNGVTDAYTVINKDAYIVSSDINAGNGYIHVLNKVLVPETRTISQIVSDLSDDYSIFKAIAKDTEIDSILKIVFNTSKTETGRTVKTKVKYTLFVHSDAAFNQFFKENNITGFSNGIEGMQRYLNSHRQSGDERDNAELLNVWAKYHVLSSEFYINDLIKKSGASGTMINTFATDETLALRYLNGVIRLNRDTERQDDGSFNTGCKLIDEISDQGATNGVIHYVAKVYTMKVTKAKALFWDVCDQEVINTHPSYRNKNGSSITGLSDDYFPQFKITAKWGSNALITYELPGWDNSKNCFVYGDKLVLQVGNNRIRQLTITTPSMNKGQYYVWFCFRHQGSGTCNVILTHNGTANKKVKYFDWWGARSDSDPVTAGYKQFMVKSVYQMSCHLLGQINVTANGPQTLILDLDKSSGNSLGAWLDMIQFIPIDDDQLWPRFDACGIAYYSSENAAKSYTDPWNCPAASADDDEEPLPED